ncbi:MAG: ribosome silencing factor [Burkholderiaceae bacterium]|nr:ribosome silencing factor [Burkholderiaceae bacterium]
MDLRKLQRIVVDALDDIKAQDIRVFDTTSLTELFDRVIIATGTSNRQTRALAAHVRDKVKEAGGKVVSMEGTDTGEWVLVDLGDAVVHIMQPAIRVYYNLEELWGAKPVRMRIEAAAPAVKKPAVRAPAAKKPAAKAPAAKKPAAKKSAVQASTPRKPAAKRSAAGKPAAPAGAPARKRSSRAAAG